MTTNKEQGIRYKQVAAICGGVFIILVTFTFILFQGQINLLSRHLNNHSNIGAHNVADKEISRLQNRVVALEASVIRLDTLFAVPVPFTPEDSLK